MRAGAEWADLCRGIARASFCSLGGKIKHEEHGEPLHAEKNTLLVIQHCWMQWTFPRGMSHFQDSWTSSSHWSSPALPAGKLSFALELASSKSFSSPSNGARRGEKTSLATWRRTERMVTNLQHYTTITDMSIRKIMMKDSYKTIQKKIKHPDVQLAIG